MKKILIETQIYLNEINQLFEGKVDDLIKKYPNVNQDIIKKFSTKDPSGTNAYLEWMIKQHLNRHNDADIVGTVEVFHKRKQALSEKDIYKYKDLKDLENTLKDSELKSKSFKAKEARSASAVYQDDRFQLFVPMNHQESRHLAQGAKWCISMNESNYWNSYFYDNNVTFFFLRNLSEELGKPNSMIAFARLADGRMDVYDFDDKQKKFDTIISEIKLDPKIINIIKNYKISDSDRIKNYFKDFPDRENMYIIDDKGVIKFYDRYGKEITDNLKVGGYLDLQGTNITELPDNLEVDGSLNLEKTPISKLPDNLKVGGYLYLRGTKITKLPDNLEVRDSIFLQGLKINEIPDTLKVGGSIAINKNQQIIIPEKFKNKIRFYN